MAELTYRDAVARGIAQEMKRDPVKLYRKRLVEFGINEPEIAKIEQESKRKVDAATEACKAAPMPPADILTTDVYADGGWAWRN